MNKDSAAGFDEIPPQFIKNAILQTEDENGKQIKTNVIAPALAQLFYKAITTNTIPASWKAARVTPIYKKGKISSPDSYRMLAVNSTLYRLFSNVLRDLLTDWCVKEQKIPDTQFGFFPDRNCMQPMFILRHLASHCKARRPHNCSKLYTAFMDFTQAYDRIDRGALWTHLTKIKMPNYILHTIQALYDDDTYSLVDGTIRTEPIKPTKGVKQGCPLSPLLFALFINDFDCLGGVTLTGQDGKTMKTTHIFYADDLVLAASSPDTLQIMISQLNLYSKMKGLTVNTEKSKILVFNSRKDSPCIYYDGVKLEVVDEFKYLGMIFNRDNKMSHADAQWSRSFMAASSRISSKIKEWGVHRRLDLALRLHNTYALSNGMYASQIWASSFIDPISPRSKTESSQLSILRFMSGARKATCSRSLVHELGQMPFRFYWFRSIVRFWNSLANSDNPLVKIALSSDVCLAKDGFPSWSYDVLQTLKNIEDPLLPLSSSFMNLSPLNLSNTVNVYINRLNKFWSDMPEHTCIRNNCVDNRKSLTYNHWFKESVKPHIPFYSKNKNLSLEDIKSIARFRLGSHYLEVEQGRFSNTPWHNRICKRCSSNSVDDAYHLLFECDFFKDDRDTLLNSYPQAFNPHSAFNPHLLADFSDHHLCKFVANCMKHIDNSYILKVDLTEGPPSLGASRLTV